MSNSYFFSDKYRTSASILIPGSGLLLMVLFASAGFGLLSTIPACALKKPNGQDAEIYIIYSTGGGMDMYESGDRYGYKLEIYDDGNFLLYRRIYREEEDDDRGTGTIRDKPVREGELDPIRLDSLRSLIDESDFFSFPRRLPDVSPHEVEHRTPAETIIITIRKDDGTMHRVQSNMGVELRHFPEDFLVIHRFLRDWQRELLME